ncbi:MAG TPA: PKD domain-containing protein [Candidatus Bathyarchaeia archaeon]|nr:PKD domain-containing protein [Candidatus Bathyarchaeia archaeon]
MRHSKATRYALLLLVAILASVFVSTSLSAHAAVPQHFLTPVPVFTQEGLTITLVLTVVNALPSTAYQFSFVVRDPASRSWTSSPQNHTTAATETQFSILVIYPSTSFVGTGSNSLVGQYNAQVNQTRPLGVVNPVVTSSFYFILTNALEYQRTETVNIQGSRYNASESVTVTIRTQTNPTVVFSRTILASSSGVVVANWKIPRNATIDNYLVTLTGTSTVKNPPDIQGFPVKAASMSVSSLASAKPSYQRTETMKFSFQAAYPDGTSATTGAALLTLANPSGGRVTLTASYNATSHNFEASYQTTTTNQTGTWTATLSANAYGDAYGNTGPSSQLTNSPQLIPASLTISVLVNTYFPVGQAISFNASITYPDGVRLQSGTVGAYMLYSGTPFTNDSIVMVYDTVLNLWVGNHPRGANDPGGLWSLVVNGVDTATPANRGTATRAINLQDTPPVALFTSTNPPILTLVPVVFNATTSYDPDGTIVTYSWNFGDGTTGNGQVASHSYNTAGPFTVTLIVTDNSGSTSSTFSQITITDRPPVVSFTRSLTTANPGQTVTVSITASDPDGTLTSVTVDWGDGTVHTLPGTQTSDSHNYSSAGPSGSNVYTITVRVTDNSGNSSSSSSTVTVQTASPSPSSGSLTFPLYYFGILAAVIAALLIGAFLAFRRHKVTHTKLKIDLEAVKSEAGRIENQEFFQSVKDQLKKDKE